MNEANCLIKVDYLYLKSIYFYNSLLFMISIEEAWQGYIVF